MFEVNILKNNPKISSPTENIKRRNTINDNLEFNKHLVNSSLASIINKKDYTNKSN